MSDEWPRFGRHGPRPNRRPAWWPEGEAWPPTGPGGRQAWQKMMRRVMRGLIGLVVMLVVLVAGSCTLAFWLTAAALGAVDLPEGMALIWRAAILGAALALAAVGVIGLVVAVRSLRRLTAPVNEFMGAVERVADGDFEARVDERGPREMRRLAQAFNRMAARLETSEAQRRSLLADVTHELRTPLTVIQGGVEGLLDGVYAADAEHLRPILDETRVLARLIDDLRTLAEAEGGTLALHREPTDLGVLCGETLAAFRAQAEAAGVRLNLEAADDLPAANVDPLRLREVIANLVANALRYTPPGGQVTVTAQKAGGNDDDSALLMTVADTGAGIGPEALPHIFERFYKGPDSRGSGLGLAIAKNLVEAHGGTITAASTPGEGTVVRVVLEG